MIVYLIRRTLLKKKKLKMRMLVNAPTKFKFSLSAHTSDLGTNLCLWVVLIELRLKLLKTICGCFLRRLFIRVLLMQRSNFNSKTRPAETYGEVQSCSFDSMITRNTTET